MDQIQIATLKDTESLLALFVRCTDTMLAAGIEQWDYTYPNRETIHADVAAQSCFVFKENDQCLATITLNEQQDPQYQGIKWQFTKGKVLVIHRLAVHPDAQGRGLGTLITQFAEQFARSNNYQTIRLDAYMGNPVSRHIYEKLGYRQAEGTCYFHENKRPFACYEKEII